MPRAVMFDKYGRIDVLDAVSLKEGDTGFVSGAVSGVGSIAVQRAKNAGAKVIGLVSIANHPSLAGVIPLAHGEGVAQRIGGLVKLVGALGLMMSLCVTVQAAEVNMADVRRLAREPVETIFSGAPIGRLSDATYWNTVQGSPKPVVVVFYANQDEQSRHLATLIRYLALEFSEAVAFYGYPVTAGATVEHNALAVLDRRYRVKKVPATLFYDNDHGKMEFEKADYAVPAVIEYRTPRPLLWTTYYQKTRKYLQDHIAHGGGTQGSARTISQQ